MIKFQVLGSGCAKCKTLTTYQFLITGQMR